GIAGVHCENSGVIKALVEEKKRLGESATVCHPQTRPYQVEAEAMDRLLRIAELADSPVIVVHLTSKEGFEEAKKARSRGQKVFLETCPQYLLLDQSLYELPLPESLKYVIAPPLRKAEDRECLWAALSDNQIQTVSTDHCSFNMQQKRMGENDFTKIPGGMPGVEDRAILVYTYGVKQNRLSLSQMCRLLSENPAKLYGAFPRKGLIAEGSDADIVVFNPDAEGVISAKTQAYNTDYAPYEGYKTCGLVEQVYLRGMKVVDGHRVVSEHKGCFVKRGKFGL
ncbi:MAG: amidohydrolase family protein, partial [Oscillospiraceae bacterium]